MSGGPGGRRKNQRAGSDEKGAAEFAKMRTLIGVWDRVGRNYKEV